MEMPFSVVMMDIRNYINTGKKHSGRQPLQLLSGRSVVRIHSGAIRKASVLRGFREALAFIVSAA